MKRLKVFIINTIILITSSIIFKSLDIYFTSYISKTIGKEYLGIYQLIISLYLFCITLATSSINLAITKLVSEKLALNKQDEISILMKKAFTITLITSTITSSILLLSKSYICKTLFANKVSENIIVLISIALPFLSLSSCIAGYFAGTRRLYKNSIGQFIEHVLKIIVTYYLLTIYIKKGLNHCLFALILGDVLSEIFSFIYIFIIYYLDKYKYYENKKSIINTIHLNSILRITIPLSISSYIRSGLYSFKQILIPFSLEKSGITSSNSLAKYGIINGMALPIILFPDILVKSFASLLIPEFSRYHSKKDYKKSNIISSFLINSSVLFSILLTILLFTFSDVISKKVYNDLSISIYIKLLSPLAIFIYVDTVIDSILKGLDKQVGVMLINIFDLVLNTSFIYFIVPYLGIKGYLISIYISEILNFSCSLFQLLYIIKKTKN